MSLSYEMRVFSGILSVVSFLLASVVGGCSLFVEWELMEVGGLVVSLEGVIDSVGLLFTGVVLLITCSVLGFSSGYMEGESAEDRFVFLVMLFVGSMGCLIFFPSLVGFMLGWDGLGVISFLLVIFYPSKSSLAAGMVTGVTNRVGDAFLVVAIILLGSWSSWHALEMFGLIGILVVGGSMTKSAQYPFSSWLLSAMAAPTPVSALVHSSTLVTAGVYLLVRLYTGLGAMELCLLEWSSGLTAFLAGIGACYESDLKKVVALSTLSQVAIMMFCVSIGLPELAFFHLLNHAIYKALLFMCVGVVIKEGGQDMRRLGESVKGNYSLKGYFFTCLVCLCGVPFLSGFYSKDLVLEGVVGGGVNLLSGVVFILGVILSGCYSARLMYYCFFSSVSGGNLGVKGYSGLEWGVHSFCFPLFFSCLCLGSGASWFFSGVSVVMLNSYYKGFLVVCSVLGAFWSITGIYEEEVNWGLGVDKVEVGTSLKSYEIFFSELGFLEGLTSQPFVWVGYNASWELYECLDQGWLEFLGPSGVKTILVEVSGSVGEYGKHAYNWVFLCYLFVVGVMGVYWGVVYF